jgi:tripartite-type tricarboxylate transporter receptor subunit TctC
MKKPAGAIGALLLLCIIFCILSAVSLAGAQSEPFYKGKTLKVLVGTTAGSLYDLWARTVAAHIGRHIPGNPETLAQNMPGAGHKIATNYMYNVAKPDGLTIIGSILPGVYMDQLVGRPEVKYDWAKFVWIGSPVKSESQMTMRVDTRYKSIEDMRNAKEPIRCGSTGTSGTDYMVSRLLEEIVPPLKIHSVLGYPGGPELDLAIERGEIVCRTFTIETYFAREPYITWKKKGFVFNPFQTGRKRDARLAEVPTLHEIMDHYKTAESGRRLATVILANGSLGRPIFTSPGTPPDRVKVLRDAFEKMLKDPVFLDDVKKKKFELDPTSGEELEAIVKEVMTQPPETIDRLKKLLVPSWSK